MHFDGLDNIDYAQCSSDDLIQISRRFALRGDDLDEATSHLRALMVGDHRSFSGDVMRSLMTILIRLEHMRYKRYQVAFGEGKNPPISCDVCGTVYTSAVCPYLYKTHFPPNPETPL
jgi:hypothetical protein